MLTSKFYFTFLCSSITIQINFPVRFGTIYLCGAFWNAPMTGTDSKVSITSYRLMCALDTSSFLSRLQGGTLVHEASHFTKNGGTQDYVYGQHNCQSLAQNDPDKAVHNADCYEYFAENNPPLA